MRVWVVAGLVAVVGCESLRTRPAAEAVGRPNPSSLPAREAGDSGASLLAGPAPGTGSPDEAPPPPPLAGYGAGGLGPDPDDDPLSLTAECLARNDPAAAADHLERYVARHPDQYLFRAQLGELLLKADRPDRARLHLERFAADAQDAPPAVRAMRVSTHTQLMELAQAAGDRPAELFHRGAGLLLVADQADADPELREEVLCKAIRALDGAKELRPTDARVRLYLADAHDRAGNRRAADAERAAARHAAVPADLTPAEARRARGEPAP